MGTHQKIKRRVRAGLASQDVVAFYVESYADDLGFDYRAGKRAGFGQKGNDLSFVIEGTTVNFEVKGAANRSSKIAVFDKSVRRRNVPVEITRVSQALLESITFDGRPLRPQMVLAGYPLDFLGMLDFYRDETDATIGLAEDHNSVSSGKLPKDFASRDPKVCRVARSVVVEALRAGGDNYFCVHDKSTDDVDAWHTGLGKDLFKFGRFPQIKSVSLDTYGGSSLGATRVGLKITL